jgi:hypothetical protein
VTPEVITALLGVGGLSVILPKIIDGLRAWKSGRAMAEKVNNRSLLSRLTDAEARAEAEAGFRRKLEEYAGTLRLLLVNAGFPAEKLPPWPVRSEKDQAH